MSQLLQYTKKSVIKFFKKLIKRSPHDRCPEIQTGQDQNTKNDTNPKYYVKRCQYSTESNYGNRRRKLKSLIHEKCIFAHSKKKSSVSSPNCIKLAEPSHPYILENDIYENGHAQSLNEYLSSNTYPADIPFEKVKFREHIRYLRRSPSNTSIASCLSTPSDKTNTNIERTGCTLDANIKLANKNVSHNQQYDSLKFEQGNIDSLSLAILPNKIELQEYFTSTGRQHLINFSGLNINWDECDNTLNMLRDKQFKSNKCFTSYKSSSTTLETWLDEEVIENSFNEDIEKQFEMIF